MKMSEKYAKSHEKTVKECERRGKPRSFISDHPGPWEVTQRHTARENGKLPKHARNKPTTQRTR